MQTGFLSPRNQPLRMATITQPIPSIVPLEMILAYVPYQTGLNLESAAELALELDSQAAETLQMDVQNA
jgi:hypothetical protein